MPTVWSWAGPDLKQAVAIDPAYTHAHSLIAWTYAARAHMDLLRCQRSLSRRLALPAAPLSLTARTLGTSLLGYVHMHARRFRPAVEELSQAIDLNPSFALDYGVLGAIFGFGGELEKGLEQLRIALRLSPRDGQQAIFLSAEAICHFVAGRYQESAGLNRRAVQLRPGSCPLGAHLLQPRGSPVTTKQPQRQWPKRVTSSQNCPSNGLRTTTP